MDYVAITKQQFVICIALFIGEEHCNHDDTILTTKNNDVNHVWIVISASYKLYLSTVHSAFRLKTYSTYPFSKTKMIRYFCSVICFVRVR